MDEANQNGEGQLCKWLSEQWELEEKMFKRRHICRDKQKEDYYCWSGFDERDKRTSGFRRILGSPQQRNVVLLATAFYVFSLGAYSLLANLLVYVTFHYVPETSPSFAGHFHDLNRSRLEARYFDESDLAYRRELYDIGFQLTPNRSDRPWWLKAAFVDSMVTIAQFVGPAVMLLFGHTQSYVCYVCLIGFQGILKGITQLITILPSANKGQYCWLVNFSEEQILAVKHQPFSSWFYQSWGTGHGCDDMLWSGHTSQSCIGVLFVNNSLRVSQVPRIVRSLLALYFAAYVGAVLACRMHYSIDVFVATIVASLMYTHSQLRYWIWWWANWIVRNERTDTVAKHELVEVQSDQESGSPAFKASFWSCRHAGFQCLPAAP